MDIKELLLMVNLQLVIWGTTRYSTWDINVLLLLVYLLTYACLLLIMLSHHLGTIMYWLQIRRILLFKKERYAISIISYQPLMAQPHASMEPKYLIYQVRCVQWTMAWPVSLDKDAFWNLIGFSIYLSILKYRY